MELAKVTSKGQITIPIEIRKKLGWLRTPRARLLWMQP